MAIVAAVAALGVLLAPNIFGTARPPDRAQELASRLSGAVGRARQTNEPVTVDVARLTPFAWDRFFVFDSYSAESARNEALGFEWDGGYGIESRDDIVLLVFVLEQKVVESIPYRGEGDFFTLAEQDPDLPYVVFTSKHARFMVRRGEVLRLQPMCVSRLPAFAAQDHRLRSRCR